MAPAFSAKLRTTPDACAASVYFGGSARLRSFDVTLHAFVDRRQLDAPAWIAEAGSTDRGSQAITARCSTTSIRFVEFLTANTPRALPPGATSRTGVVPLPREYGDLLNPAIAVFYLALTIHPVLTLVYPISILPSAWAGLWLPYSWDCCFCCCSPTPVIASGDATADTPHPTAS